ncbi:MAG: cupin domain-containing protein [Gammaproteobacteria bacterium]|nr:MAG: cupin domain-containing protein [Gammaproteobacteria bacterium]
MQGIRVEKNPTRQRLEQLGVFEWGIWSKEISVFPWTYDCDETCYFLAGDVVVTPEGGEPLAMGEGDLVTFPAGLSCTWDIRRAVRKHYRFD